MKKITLLVLALMLWSVLPTHADEYRPPLQAEFDFGKVLNMYDCYPYYDGEPLSPLHVYLAYDEGIATYSCYQVGAAEGHYIPPHREELAYYVGENH